MADPNPIQPADLTLITQLITYGGMLLGGAVATILVRLGFKRLPVPETEVAVTGGAAITDMKPVRDTLEQLNVLTLQMQQLGAGMNSVFGALASAATSLEHLADLLAAFIQMETRERETEERESEIDRRVSARWDKIVRDNPALATQLSARRNVSDRQPKEG